MFVRAKVKSYSNIFTTIIENRERWLSNSLERSKKVSILQLDPK